MMSKAFLPYFLINKFEVAFLYKILILYTPMYQILFSDIDVSNRGNVFRTSLQKPVATKHNSKNQSYSCNWYWADNKIKRLLQPAHKWNKYVTDLWRIIVELVQKPVLKYYHGQVHVLHFILFYFCSGGIYAHYI